MQVKKSKNAKMQIAAVQKGSGFDTGANLNMLLARFVTEVRPYNGVLSMWNKTIRSLLTNNKKFEDLC